MIESRRAIIAPVMVTPVFITPLEDLVDEVFLGDVAGQRIADQLDVVVDRCQLPLLILNHRAQAVVNAFDVGEIALQRADGRGVVFWSHRHEVLACRWGGGGSRAGGPFLAREATG